MGAFGPQTVVEALPTLSDRRAAAASCRRSRHGGRARPANDNGRAATLQGLVDGTVRERLVLNDRSLVVEPPYADELGWRTVAP